MEAYGHVISKRSRQSPQPMSIEGAMQHENSNGEPNLSQLPDVLPFDVDLLNHYNVHNPHAADKLVDLLRVMYENGNAMIRESLANMVWCMINRLNNFIDMERTIFELTQENQRLRRLESENSETNERIVHLENSVIPTYQTRVANLEEQFNAAMESYRELEISVMRSDELECQIRNLNSTVRSLTEQNQRTQTELSGSKKLIRTLNQTIELFKDPVDRNQLEFPMIQTNGEMTDFFKIVSVWAKSAGEDDGHPYRHYMCPNKKTMLTSLAQFQFTSRIQSLAVSLGLSVEPPILFEFKQTTWVQFGLHDQVCLVARVCFMYANRRLYETNGRIESVVTEHGIADLKLTKASPQSTLHSTIRQGDAAHPISIRINRANWNPFPDMVFMMEVTDQPN